MIQWHNLVLGPFFTPEGNPSLARLSPLAFLQPLATSSLLSVFWICFWTLCMNGVTSYLPFPHGFTEHAVEAHLCHSMRQTFVPF